MTDNNTAPTVHDALQLPHDGAQWLCYASIDTRTLIEALDWEERCPEADLGIEGWDSMGREDEAEAIDAALGTPETLWDNTYNWSHEHDLNAEVDFRVWAPGGDHLYEACWILLRVHRGGDVRGNYGGSELYFCPSGLAGFVMAGQINWTAEDAQGEAIEACDYSLPTVLAAARAATGDDEFRESGEWQDGAFVLDNGCRLFPMASEA